MQISVQRMPALLSAIFFSFSFPHILRNNESKATGFSGFVVTFPLIFPRVGMIMQGGTLILPATRRRGRRKMFPLALSFPHLALTCRL